MSLKKLQGEIEKTVKKINEGLTEFHSIWAKFDAAPTQVLKEKYEGDLKKEIKKLQRLRDQIKVWQTLDEIKDKQILNDTRKAIETQMERFKVLEKEMKIKAFSKEGLSLSAKLSPQEKEKLDLAEWLRDSVEALNTQMESYEAEIETLEAQSRKGSKSADQKRHEALNGFVDNHKHHIEKLEVCLRLLENDQIDNEKITNIKDSVEYYISSHQEPDFVDDEELYEDIESSALPYSLKVDLADDDAKSPASAMPIPTSQPSADKPKVPMPVVAILRPNQAPTTSKDQAAKVVEVQNAPIKAPVALQPSAKLQTSFVSAAATNLPAESEKPKAPRQSQFSQLSDFINGHSDSLRVADDAFISSFFDNITTTAIMDAEPIAAMNEIPHADSIYPYPTTRHAAMSAQNLFSLLDLDTLFYIFYYIPNSLLQCMASTELKRQSWRFHKKYMTWFQRFEEPSVITNDFEQGTYVYFDYEGSWCQRKKTDFTFEYKDLEDEVY